MSFRIGLVEDHALMRRALRSLLEAEGYIVAMEYGTAESFLSATEAWNQGQLDLLLIDISLGKDMNGFELIHRIRNIANYPFLIVVHSMHDSSLHMSAAKNAGANAFVSKQSEPEVLLNTLHDVLCSNCQNSSQESSLLSAVEQRVLMWIGEGLKPAQIAQRMDLSVHTIETHRRRIRQKLNLDDAQDLIRFAILHRTQ